MEARSSRPSVASRILAVLGTFEESHRTQTLTEISRRADIPLATCHRYVRELVEWGALARGRDGIISVGGRLWELALLAPVNRDLKDVAAPYMHDLYRATRCIVHLAVRDGEESLHVERIFGPEPPSRPTQVGSRVRLYATATGKVLLAHAPQEVVDGVLTALVAETRHTITDSNRLTQALQEVRRRGYARTDGEFREDRFSLAVPITSDDGAVIASIGIVRDRPFNDPSGFIPALQVAAHGIARRRHPAMRGFDSAQHS